MDWAVERDCVGFVEDRRFEINQSEHSLGGCFPSLELVQQHPEDEHRHRHARGDKQECYELPNCYLSRLHEPATSRDQQSERNSCDYVDAGDETVAQIGGMNRLIPIVAALALDARALEIACVVGLHCDDASQHVLEDGDYSPCTLALLAIAALDPCREPDHHRDDKYQGDA